VRLFDPEHDANLLLQNTFALNSVVCKSFVIASALLHAFISCLMRYVWNVEGMLSMHERDTSIDVCEATVMKLEDLTPEALTMTLKLLKEALPAPRATGTAAAGLLGPRHHGKGDCFSQSPPARKPVARVFFSKGSCGTNSREHQPWATGKHQQCQMPRQGVSHE
jgi:hypothetical protein